MDIQNARSPVYVREDQSMIDMEIEHPAYGWIAFSASPDDVEGHGRDLYARALAGEFGPVADYVPPAP
jgi:hypothetical protein